MSVMVEVPEPGAAIDTGLNVAVVPLGSPVALRAIAELKPPEPTVVIVVANVLLPLAPWTENEFGEAVMVNAGTVTVRETVAVCVVPPLVPVMVIVYVPVKVVEATAIVIVEVPEPGAAIDVGLKVTVTPVG